MTILIKNGRILDPATGTDRILDLLIENDRIKELSEHSSVEADRVIDAAGFFVVPGFIDLHVHLRDPGFVYKETVETGMRAAAAGGFTTILAMPNTKPVADCAEVVRYVKEKASEVGLVNVLQVGAITVGQHGDQLSDIEGMAEEGIPALSEDGKSVMNAELYREAMMLAKKYDMPILAHCEDKNLVNGGVVNRDRKSKELGLSGITNAVEDVIVARDILLAKETGARLHLCHCSTKDSVRMIELAKQEGIAVTAEVCPHHFCLTSEDIPGDDANYKMNPPLRTKEDRDALIDGLRRGIIDAIATDHAPHSREEKQQSMRTAPFGIVGLETAAALTMTKLVHTGILTPLQMAERMSLAPARIAGLDRGSLAPGKVADLTILDPNEEYTIDTERFQSKGRNTPFQGEKVKGSVKMTITSGRIVYENGTICKGEMTND